jgi:hypothetical protein
VYIGIDREFIIGPAVILLPLANSFALYGFGWPTYEVRTSGEDLHGSDLS